MEVNISVVVPTYRRARLLRLCLTLLWHQRFAGTYEVIVVSDGEDEETALLMNEFAHRQNPVFTYMSLPKKGGPAAARNTGWQEAKGDLVLFTDDDTQPSAKWLQSLWDAYLQTGKKEVAFSGQVHVPLLKQPTDYERNTAGLETADFVTANCAVTKSALQKIDGFDEAFTMAWREDSDLQFKLMNASVPIIKITEAIVLHPVRKAAWGVSLKEQKKSMFNALLYKKHPHLFRSRIFASPLWNYYALIILFIAAIVFFIGKWYVLATFFLSGWLLLEVAFIIRRLRNNSRSLSHIGEMVVTSLLIPFLSVYWTLYGAFKFKVVFL